MGKIRELSAAELFSNLEKMRHQFDIAPTDILAQTIKNVAAKATAKLDAEMATKEQNFLDKHEGSDWWELAKKQYPITETADGFTIVSQIAERDYHKRWAFTHKYLAFAKVEQLVRWTHSNRIRGHGDMDLDLERWSDVV